MLDWRRVAQMMQMFGSLRLSRRSEHFPLWFDRRQCCALSSPPQQSPPGQAGARPPGQPGALDAVVAALLEQVLLAARGRVA